MEVVGDAVLDPVLRVLLICSVSGKLRSVSLGCTLETVASSFFMGILGSDGGTYVASISCVSSCISCSCFAVTTGLRFKTLARSDIAFIILLACNNDRFVVF